MKLTGSIHSGVGNQLRTIVAHRRQAEDRRCDRADPGADAQHLAHQAAREREQAGDRQEPEDRKVNPGHATAVRNSDA